MKLVKTPALQKEMADDRFEEALAIREILTPEQRMKLSQPIEQVTIGVS